MALLLELLLRTALLLLVLLLGLAGAAKLVRTAVQDWHFMDACDTCIASMCFCLCY